MTPGTYPKIENASQRLSLKTLITIAENLDVSLLIFSNAASKNDPNPCAAIQAAMQKHSRGSLLCMAGRLRMVVDAAEKKQSICLFLKN